MPVFQIEADITSDVIKEDCHQEASEFVVCLLPISSCYIATEYSYAKGEPQGVWEQFGNFCLMAN